MSNMFDNYEITSSAPNNLTRVYTYARCKMPNAEYDENGKLVAYTWQYGETVNLRFQLTGQIEVEQNSIVYYAAGETPTTSTVGTIDEKAYNVRDLISWTCTAIAKEGDETIYTWTQDNEFTYPPNGGKSVYVSISDYMQDKKVIFTLMNDRYIPVYDVTFQPNDTFFIVSIDEELSQKLLRGVYYYTICIYDENAVTRKMATVESNMINIR